MSDVNKLLDLSLRAVRQHYKTYPKVQLPPLVHAVKDDDILALLELNFDSDFHKTVSIAAAAMFLRERECDASIFISEAWMATAKNDEDLLAGPRPAERPDRVEVLLAEVSTSDHYVIAMFKMVRDQKGRLINLDEFERHDSKNPRDGMSLNSRFDFFDGLESSKLARKAQGSTKH